MKDVMRHALRASVLAAALAAPASGAPSQQTPAYTDATPGWTGHILLKGSHSRIADAVDATRRAQTGL